MATTNDILQPPSSEVKADSCISFLKALYKPGEVRELRIIQPDKRVVAGYFDDINKILQSARQYNGKASIYIDDVLACIKRKSNEIKRKNLEGKTK